MKDSAPLCLQRTSALWHLPTTKLRNQMANPNEIPSSNPPQMAGCQQEPCSRSSLASQRWDARAEAYEEAAGHLEQSWTSDPAEKVQGQIVAARLWKQAEKCRQRATSCENAELTHPDPKP